MIFMEEKKARISWENILSIFVCYIVIFMAKKPEKCDATALLPILSMTEMYELPYN